MIVIMKKIIVIKTSYDNSNFFNFDLNEIVDI